MMPWEEAAQASQAILPWQEAAAQAPPTQNPPPAQQPFSDQLEHQLGLTGRYLMEGPADAIAGIGDLANKGINAVAGTNLGMPTQYVGQALDAMGFPQPQGALEQGVGTASKIASGLMAGGENTVNTGKQMASNLGDMLSSPSYPTSSAEVKQIASQLYQQAADSGGVLKPSFTDDFVDTVSQHAPQTEAGKIVAGDTPVTQLVARLQALKGKPLSLPEVQEIDEHLGDLIDSEYGIKGLSKTGYKLQDMQSSLRGMIHDANPEDAVGGTEGFDSLNDARKAWSQAMKMQDVERIQTRAGLSDNPATSIKSGVRTMLSNPARTRGWDDGEIEALQKAGDRGVLGGTLHVFGSRLMPFVGTVAGESAGGIPGAIIGSMIGHGGSTLMRNGATAIQNSRLANVLETLGQNVGQ